MYIGTKKAKNYSKLVIFNPGGHTRPISYIEEGYELMEFALLWDYSQFEYLINNDCGSLEIAQESFHKISLSFIIPEKAPFKRAFDNQ